MASDIDIADTAVPYNGQYDPLMQIQSVILLRVPHVGYIPCLHIIAKQVDRVQDSFLEEIGIDAVTAFSDFNLAPLPVRRDIAML